MPYHFDGKVVLITGAGSGIGRASAIKLSGLGARLALSDINGDGLKETNSLVHDPAAVAAIVDVSSSSDCARHVQEVATACGGIDHVFNCAGINPTAHALEDTTDDYWDKLVNTNLRGVYNMTRAAIPHLKPGASFVNVSSICGLHPFRGYAIYCATKYGLIGFSKAMALELGPSGFRVNVVAPGFIHTPTNSGVVAGPAVVKEMEAQIATGRLGDAEEIADVVAFLFSNEARYMNGSVVEVNGGTG